MTAARLAWVDDNPALNPQGVSLDAVTAWALLTDSAHSARPDEHMFFTVFDTANPTATLKQTGSLHTVLRSMPKLTAEMNHQMGEWSRRNAGIPEPRLFALPLQRGSLPDNIDDLLSFNPSMGFSSVGLAGPQELADLPPIPSRRPLPPGEIGRIRPRVIVGIIDYAINLAHARFQNRTSKGDLRSRIAHAWLQDGRYRTTTVPFGCEVDAGKIAAALSETHEDEEAALRHLGLLHFGGRMDGNAMPPKTELARRASHGTHVLDLAAGRDPSDPEGMEVQIIAVVLPDSVRRDTTGTLLSLFFLHGLEYILLRCRDITGANARAGRREIPVFICASLGFAGGPRGGRHLIERAIDALVVHHVGKLSGGGNQNNVQVVLPAGNSNLARGHAVSERSAEMATLSVPWRLQPADRTANHLEAWIAYEGADAPDSVTLEIVPPGTLDPPQALVLLPGQSRRLVLGPDGSDRDETRTIGRVALEQTTGERLWRLSIALAATDPGATGFAAAPAGAWEVTISAHAPKGSGTELEIDAWILRDDDPVEQSATARQSYFDCPSYSERDDRGELRAEDPKPPGSVVRRGGSLNAIATGKNRMVVGGFVQPTADSHGTPTLRKVAAYSGSPLPDGRLLANGESVYWAAPCESSPVLSGVMAAGSRCGSLVALNGTSMAVPQVVRALTEGFLKEGKTPANLSLVAKATPDPRVGQRPIRSPLPNNRADARAAKGLSGPRL